MSKTQNSAPTSNRSQELSLHELDHVVGGVTFNVTFEPERVRWATGGQEDIRAN